MKTFLLHLILDPDDPYFITISFFYFFQNQNILLQKMYRMTNKKSKVLKTKENVIANFF